MTCIDLRDYGDRYRVHNEVENRKARSTDDPWDLILPGRSGFVAPYGGEFLLACTRRQDTTRRILATVPDAVVTQDGGDGQNVKVHARHLHAVAEVLRLRRKRQAQEGQADRLAAFRFPSNPAAHARSGCSTARVTPPG